MAVPDSPKRRARRRMLCVPIAVCAPIVLCAATSHAATPDPSEQCIVGDRAIGCVDERSIIELTTRRKDAGALQQLVQDKLASSQCRLFDYGERVQVTSAHGNERTQVRRPGDKTSYWIAASWSRPAAECEGTKSAAALHQKLGLPDATRQQSDADERAPSYDDERVPSDPDERGLADAEERGSSFAGQRRSPRHRRDDYGDDEEIAYDRARRPPPWPSRPLPSSRYAHHCDFKSVMTDADLLACRNMRR